MIRKKYDIGVHAIFKLRFIFTGRIWYITCIISITKIHDI